MSRTIAVMLPKTPRAWLAFASRIVIGGILAWAAVPKLLDPGTFAESIGNYHLVSELWARMAAAILPVVELVVAAALLANVRTRGAALLAALMFVVFGLAMTQAVVRGINLDCGCFGSGQAARVTWWSVARNAGLTLLACCVMFWNRPAEETNKPIL